LEENTDGMRGTSAYQIQEIQAQEMIEQSGFKVASVEESGPYHYLITAHPA